MTLTHFGAAALSFWLALCGQGHAEQRTICPGGAIALDTSVPFKPYVRMRLGAHEGNFLIDTGANVSSVDAGLYGVAPGTRITIKGSSLPTLDSGSFVAADQSHEAPFAPPGGAAGFIGTNILSSRTVEFHYETPSPYMVLSTQRCPPRIFEDAGFVSIAQPGFGPWPWLSWLSWPWSRITGRTDLVRHANLPVIYARIGSVRVPLWVDTGWGFGATRHMTFPINQAGLNRLRDAGVAMHRAGTSVNSDCQGHRAEDPIWKVDNEPIVLTTEDGSVLFEYGPPDLQLHDGGECLTHWSEPIGTLGALFLPRFGTVVFDGPNRRVWIPKPGTVTPAQDGFRSMAFARDERGAWSLSTRETLDDARAESLKSCNAPRNDCRIDVTIGPSRFACLAIAKKPNVGLPAPATSGSLAAARSAALTACTSANGTGCALVYSGCND
jgi:hypothetical protein